MVSHSRLTAALAAAFVALAAPAGQALAHHAFQAEYECAPITVTGKVTLIEWVTPHTWVHVKPNDSTKPEWMFEGSTPATLERVGLNRTTLKAGDNVTIRGHLAKDKRCLESPETHVATCRGAGGAIILADGTVSNLVDGSRILNHSSFDRYGATPEQLLAQLTDFCSPPETRGK